MLPGKSEEHCMKKIQRLVRRFLWKINDPIAPTIIKVGSVNETVVMSQSLAACMLLKIVLLKRLMYISKETKAQRT